MDGGKDCYPESNVLINKYNIRDKELLEKFEIQKVFAKLIGLDVKPTRISYTYDARHLVSIHKYLFGDIYEWAGSFRKENLYKSERVLSGGFAEYAEYHEIEKRLETLLRKYDQKYYLIKIISDALQDEPPESEYLMSKQQAEEQYRIAKTDYEAFREKYSIKK